MRADRLLAILLILQSRGRATARELARDLEVSERTIYRDMDALCTAGVPLYGMAGPEGGYALVDNYRTRLTGLTEGEIRAMFMLGGLAPLADLGVSQALRSALRKLSAALPSSSLGDQDKVIQCFHFDSTWWQRRGSASPHLRVVQEAIWADRKLQISYHPPFTDTLTQLVAPYGLVAKAGDWYLVCARENGALDVQQVSKLTDVHLSQETFVRDSNFDLVAFWGIWCRDYENLQRIYTVLARVAPNMISELPRYFGNSIHKEIAQADPPDGTGWLQLELAFESFEQARERILILGSGIEVLAPEALKLSVMDYAEQILGVYK